MDPERSVNRRYDVVVFGATGFTGQFVVEELYRLQGEGNRVLNWAAAGRNKAKVEAFLKASGIKDIDVLSADTNDQSSLDAMCATATVIIDCVGPYQLYGEPVVKACISERCNYVDITGESYYMESIEAKYDKEARSAGVYIVSCCGFDCIPNDLGALLLQKSFHGDLAYVDSYIQINGNMTFNTGTWESLVRSINSHWKLTKLRKELNLPSLTLPAIKPPFRRPLFFSDVIQQWCVPFHGCDRAVVYRSQRYFQQNAGINAFKFRPYLGFRSIWQVLGVILVFTLLLFFVMTEWGLKLLIKYPHFFSGGLARTPSRKELEGVTFMCTLEGTGYSPSADRSAPPDSKMTVKVSGIDPGYGATSTMLVQSALCFVDERESLPSCGGVYTPAAVFGNTNIVGNLNNTGKVKFEIIE